MPRVIRPVPDRDDAFFWDAVKEGRLVAHACANCGRLAQPPAPAQPAPSGTQPAAPPTAPP